jgi:hypothetical protein
MGPTGSGLSLWRRELCPRPVALIMAHTLTNRSRLNLASGCLTRASSTRTKELESLLGAASKTKLPQGPQGLAEQMENGVEKF